MFDISDEKLYLYIFNPTILTLEERNIIEKLILESTELSDLIKEFREYVNEFNNLEEEVRSELYDTVKKRLKAISSIKESEENILQMIPLHLENKQPSLLKLVAMQNTSLEDKFVYIKTFVSAQKYMILRLMKNYARSEYKVFLICEDMNKVSFAVLNFENVNNDFVTDAEGFLNFISNYPIEDINSTVHIPLSVYELHLSKLESMGNIMDIQPIKGTEFTMDIELIDRHNLHLKFKPLNGIASKDLKVVLRSDSFVGIYPASELKSDFTAEIHLPDVRAGKIYFSLVERDNIFSF